MGGIAIGVNLNTDIDKGVFDRFRSLPIARSAPLVGAVLADIVRYVIVCVVIVGFGYVLGYRAETNAPEVLAGCLLAVAFALCFCWGAVFVGMVARTPGAVQGIMMLLVLPLSFASSTFVPTATMPGWLQTVVDVNPLTPPDRRRARRCSVARRWARTCCGRSPGWPACWPSSCRSPYGRTVAASEPAGASRARAASRSAPRPRAYAAPNASSPSASRSSAVRRGDLEVRLVLRTAQHRGRAEHLRGVDGPALAGGELRPRDARHRHDRHVARLDRRGVGAVDRLGGGGDVPTG